MIFLGTRGKCCDKGNGTIDNYEDRVRLTSASDVNLVNDNNVPKIVSAKASHLARLRWWLLLDAVLTPLHNILVKFINILWQTQTGSSVFELCW